MIGEIISPIFIFPGKVFPGNVFVNSALRIENFDFYGFCEVLFP